MGKTRILVSAILAAMLSVTLVAAQPSPLVALNDFFGSDGFSGWYTTSNLSLWIDLLVYLVFFIFASNFLIAKQNKITNQLEAWGTGSGVLLAAIFTLLELFIAFRLIDTGMIGMILILIVLAVSGFFATRLTRLDVYGSVGVAYILVYIVFFSVIDVLLPNASASLIGWITAVLNLLLIIAIVAILVSIALLIMSMHKKEDEFKIEADVNQQGNIGAETTEQEDVAEESEVEKISRLCQRATAETRKLEKNFTEIGKLMRKGSLQAFGAQINKLIQDTQPVWSELQNYVRLISGHVESLNQLENQEALDLERAVQEAAQVVSDEQKALSGVTEQGKQKAYGKKTIENTTSQHLAAARQELANKITITKNELNTALGNALQEEKNIFDNFSKSLQLLASDPMQAQQGLDQAIGSIKQLQAILGQLGKTDMDKITEQIRLEMQELKDVDHIAELTRSRL